MVSLLLINSNYSEISNKLLGSAEMTINQLRHWCTISKLLPQDVFFVDVQRTTFGGVFHKKSDSQCIKPVRFHMKSMT
jgi:hypothetical protein